MIEVLRAKLHGIHVTGCDLDYHGSVTLDPQICERAGILPLEFVYIWNKNNGQRISTYVLFGEPGTRCWIRPRPSPLTWSWEGNSTRW